MATPVTPNNVEPFVWAHVTEHASAAWWRPTHRMKGDSEARCMLLETRADYVVVAYRPTTLQRQTDVSTTMPLAVFRLVYEALS